MYFDPVEYGKRLKDSREKNKMIREDLAEKLGISIGHLKKMEKGERVGTVELLIAVSEALDVSLDFLLKGEESDHESERRRIKEDIRILDEVEKTL